MKNLNFYRFIAFCLIGFKVFALGVGDYIDYTEDKNKLEYGTVMEILGGGKFRIRPHRTIGDFIADITKLPMRVLEDAKAIKQLQPKKGEYSINLMWVKNKPDGGLYVFPDNGIEESLAKVVHWAKKNPSEKVVVWYDGAMVVQKAVPNTYEVLSRIFPQFAKQIIFNDLRVFPEIKENPKVFSPKIPVYFRVDLLRVIAAYNIIKRAAEEGLRYYFVYSDIDVTSMNKDEIFDASTMMDLNKYGIVMAHGGYNQYNFENSFQIWSSTNQDLLVAAKAALIDINIIRAQNILGGGNWINSQPNDASPLEQVVYNSYVPMFHYFYYLQGWIDLSLEIPLGILVDFNRQDIMDTFGVNDGKYLPILKKNPEVKFNIESIDLTSGKKISASSLYIPRKIIEAPASRHGGQPTKYPKDISIRN